MSSESERYKLVDVDMTTGSQDDEKDDFYGCSCQRYLCVGLIMPFLLLVAFLGLIFNKMSKLFTTCFGERRFFTKMSVLGKDFMAVPWEAFEWAS